MNANYLNFLGGQTVTIREILSRKKDPKVDLICFQVSLFESTEIIKVDVLSEKAELISVGTKIKFCNTDDAIGYSIWMFGYCPIEV